MNPDDRRSRQESIEKAWRAMWSQITRGRQHGRKARHGSAFIPGGAR